MKFALWTLLFSNLLFASPSANYVVHLLSYIQKDYAVAVQNGQVISPEEYQEQIDFVNAAMESARTIPVIANDLSIDEDLKKLQRLVLKKAAPLDVALAAKSAELKVIEKAAIVMAPRSWPQLHRGKQSFDQSCSQCHGMTGNGDGPSGKNLDPKPSDFHAEGMNGTSPFQVYNTIRLGVPGTGMAAFSDYSDEQVWDLAFYVISLRHQEKKNSNIMPTLSLAEIAENSDEALKLKYPKLDIAQLRMYEANPHEMAFQLVRKNMNDGLEFYRQGNIAAAKQKMVEAYLDGIEPIEPPLRSKDGVLTLEIEQRMGNLRSIISSNQGVPVLENEIASTESLLVQAEAVLNSKSEKGATFAFTVAAGIFLREAFEAVLVLITLLGVVKSLKVTAAVRAIHAGWFAALLIGVVLWFFSGWALSLSGMNREILEGGLSLFAVAILLYFGFWLHRHTEIGRWRNFVQTVANKAAAGGSLMAIGFVSFMAVFRESFETVLFLRTLLLDVGPHLEWAVLLGVGLSFLFVVLASTALIRYSVKIPIRQLFHISSVLLVILCLVMVGKGIHSLQEAGVIDIKIIEGLWGMEWIGFYPTYQTLLGQGAILVMSLFLWLSGRNPSLPKVQTTDAEATS